MVEVNLIKNKIIDSIKKRGPSLPIQIAKEIGINSLFTSAFLSELADENKIKVSSLKVGGSPLYFLEGQEEKLEKFHTYLPAKEIEAFLLLKNNKILKESEQEPAIRVALRSIKDFAVSFKNEEEHYWRYTLITEPEVIEMFVQKPKEIPEENTIKIDEKKEIIEIKPEISKPEEIKIEPIKKQEEKVMVKKIVRHKEKILEPKSEFNNPLVIKTIEKPKKEKPKSEFVLKAIEFINKNGFRIIEEKEHKAKEYLAIIQTDSSLGPTDYLTQAKNKRIISESDLKNLLSNAQSIPLPALIIYTGEINKKAREYIKKYYSILKAKKLE